MSVSGSCSPHSVSDESTLRSAPLSGSVDEGSSVRSAPLGVSVEELRSELSLLGFTSVPEERLLQFKQDLEYLMRSRAALELTAGSSGDEDLKKERQRSEGLVSAWDNLPAWPAAHHQPPAHKGDLDSYTKHTVRSGAQDPEKSRAPVVTRKVLRRKSDGQLQVCDESLSSADTEPEDSRVSGGELHAVKSFIRLPSHSLLEQYRQRSDPVGRYQEYKQSWDALQGSLEKRRKELRWGVRERMMSAPPLSLPRALPVSNSYVIPTEKKRYGLRWAIRQDLVNGHIPRGDSS
ncbi:hypothetical protein GDO81_026851 [Engystomops pustulosus]|uniref:Centriolar and ciliogenesis-associated protein HYLS1 C-terminal domain-containing protein n=1 Tax=Engystomops pustulosus TaxID=76066 RepID=A0AAV6YQB6_ENGPU|nr:hypothetical protein GDO81_026851 [Engystomops pustulosus]